MHAATHMAWQTPNNADLLIARTPAVKGRQCAQPASRAERQLSPISLGFISHCRGQRPPEGAACDSRGVARPSNAMLSV